MMDSDFVPDIVDVEASGFGRGSYPIEVGVALSDGGGYCSLIRPESQWTHWDATAEQVHGISREILQQYSQPLVDVANQLNGILQGRTVFSDGWGVDRTWLALLFDCAGIAQKFKLEALTVLFHEQQFDAWNSARETVLREMDFRRHRASNDAKVIQQTYLRTRGPFTNE